MNIRLSLMLGLMLICFVGCHKENNGGYQSKGQILGPDLRLCACCGGWYILIDHVTYEFDTLPANSNFDLQHATFPVSVKLDWQLSNKSACPDTRIEIIRISKE
ncbi:MAG: hypothetical protein Q8908_07400 [Bacteroidota bacterium]|nr:hypothetical protein [Bacteroidota bacterium]